MDHIDRYDRRGSNRDRSGMYRFEQEREDDRRDAVLLRSCQMDPVLHGQSARDRYRHDGLCGKGDESEGDPGEQVDAVRQEHADEKSRETVRKVNSRRDRFVDPRTDKQPSECETEHCHLPHRNDEDSSEQNRRQNGKCKRRPLSCGDDELPNGERSNGNAEVDEELREVVGQTEPVTEVDLCSEDLCSEGCCDERSSVEREQHRHRVVERRPARQDRLCSYGHAGVVDERSDGKRVDLCHCHAEHEKAGSLHNSAITDPMSAAFATTPTVTAVTMSFMSRRAACRSMPCVAPKSPAARSVVAIVR